MFIPRRSVFSPFTTATTTITTRLFKPTTPPRIPRQLHRHFCVSSRKMAASGPPKHEMVYLKGLLKDPGAQGNFRKVLHTGLYSQLVSMEIPPGGDIGDEVHLVDQTLLFTSGAARAVVAGRTQSVSAGDVVVVPAGTQHQFYNDSDSEPLRLLTVYAPAEHDSKTVHQTKEEGDEEEEAGGDKAPEWSRKSKRENEGAGLVKGEGGPYEE